jgi:hypothetical protein
MKRLVLAALALVLTSGVVAQEFTPPGRPFAPNVLRLGDFTTLFISCGTPVTPTCPQTRAPLERPVLVHYITLGGRSTTNCSGWLFVNRTTAEGLVQTELMRLVLAAGATDNMVLTFPKPLRLETGDVIGLAVAQGTCAVLADFGVEFTE